MEVYAEAETNDDLLSSLLDGDGLLADVDSSVQIAKAIATDGRNRVH